MSNNFKDIHIGSLLLGRVSEKEISISRICDFLNCTANEVVDSYEKKSLDSEVLLRWSKLLEYDFFRVYSHHLILYSPPSSMDLSKVSKSSTLPKFRKSLYTKEVIDFILDLINTGAKSRAQVIQEYKIPKSTLHKWVTKYSKKDE